MHNNDNKMPRSKGVGQRYNVRTLMPDANGEPHYKCWFGLASLNAIMACDGRLADLGPAKLQRLVEFRGPDGALCGRTTKRNVGVFIERMG